MIKIGINGICGKMGRRILSLSLRDKGLKVVFGLESKTHPQIGRRVENIPVTQDPKIIRDCDCLIDFSAAAALIECLSWLIKFKKSAVIGTTGFAKTQLKEIKKASAEIPVVFSPNMSIGVNLLFNLLSPAAKVLRGYKVSIEEAHHVHKKDSPSGTAKMIAEVLNRNGFNIKIEDIISTRTGEVVGDHRVIFESDTDRIELFHSAKTRDIFAQGALLAAKWVVGKPAGLYSMKDVLFAKSEIRNTKLETIE